VEASSVVSYALLCLYLFVVITVMAFYL